MFNIIYITYIYGYKTSSNIAYGAGLVESKFYYFRLRGFLDIESLIMETPVKVWTFPGEEFAISNDWIAN